MYGTVQPQGFLARTLAALGYVKAAPNPASLYPSQPGMTFAPISFPGWAEYEQRAGGQDEQRARTAVTSAWVFSDVQAIGNELAVAELAIKRRAGEDLEEEANHDLERLWEAPNPFMGKGFLMRFWTWQLLLFGKAFIFWAPREGAPAELWPVPSLYLKPIPHPQTFIDGYVFKSNPTAKPIRIDSKYITYTRLPHPFDIRDGLSPLAAIYDAIESDLFMRNWNKAFFSKENAAPTGLITVNRDMLDSDLSRVRTEIMDFFGGSNGRRVGVARAGDMDWKPFDRSQKEMEFLEGRRFSRSEIDRAFGFPEGYWSADATRANSEGAKATMIENACWPHLVSLQEDMNAQNIPAFYGEDIRAEFNDIRPRNRMLELKEFGAYQAVETVDELRERIGKKPIGDVRGLMLVSEINKGTPIPTTPASEETEAAISAMEEEVAPVEDVASEVAPEADPLAPVSEPGPPVDGAPTDADTLMDRLDASGAKTLPELQEIWHLEDTNLAVLDRKRWETKALKALKNGKPALVPFAPDALTEGEVAAITAALALATTPDAVRLACKAREEELIDTVWDGALTWAQKAMEGE